MNPGKLPPVERLRSLLSYDPESGLLTWRKNRNWKTTAGSVAGRIRKSDRYLIVKVDCVAYLAHRICWAIHNGKEPFARIDHRDLDRSNNRIENLRLATISQNCANSPKNRFSKSPYKCVIWNVRDNCWRARMTIDGKRKQIGSFQTAEAAHLAYQAMATKIHGEFARSK